MQFDFKRALQSEAKAIRAHPALQGREPITTYAPGAQNPREDAKISQREAPRHLQAYGGDQAIDWVMDCVRLYGDTVSTASWHVEKDDKRVDTPKDLKDLMAAPNPYQDYAEVVDLLITDLLLVGNAYWFKWRTTSEGKPLAIYRLSPSHVDIIPGPLGPKRYEYQPPGAKDPLKIDPKDLIHYRLPNPHSQYYGLGIIQGGGRPFDLELALTDTQASYFENKADPSMIVQSDRRVPRDVFNKLRAQLRQRVAGSGRAGELLVLEAGLKASSLSASAREAMFLELTKMSRDRILAMFRASPMLFGLLDEAGGGNKVQDARREFDTKTIRPFIDKLQARITAGLVAAWGLDFKIDYEYIMPPEELVKLSGDFAAIPGIKVKEVRRFLVKGRMLEDESTGDKDIDDMVLNLPGEELDANGQGGFADRNLPREAGRPPKGENTNSFPKNGGALPAGAAVRRPGQKAQRSIEEVMREVDRIADSARVEEKAVKLESPENVSVGRKLSKEERPQDHLEAQRDADLDATIDFMRSGIGDAIYTLERGLLDNVEGKAFKPSDLKNRIKRSAAWKSFMTMLSAVIEEGAKRAISAAAVHQGSEGRIPDGDLDYEAIAKRVVYRSEGVERITKNLRDEIVQKVGQALSEGKERGDVEQIIRESIDFWREGKAQTVAMTEAIHAYNEGTLVIAEETGAIEVMVSDGRDHDQPCIDADGSVWDIEYAREHRLEHPRCRRAFLPLTPQE